MRRQSPNDKDRYKKVIDDLVKNAGGRYGIHLDKTYPEEMLAFYKPIIIEEASRANGRSHYRKVANRLSALLKIKGGRDIVEELLQKFRTTYIRRPAMIDELKKVL